MTRAETAILAIVRQPHGGGVWCLRELPERSPRAAKGRFAIVDNARWDSPVIVQAQSWEDVLARLTNLKVHGTRCEILAVAGRHALALSGPDSTLVCSCPFGRHP